MSKKPRARFVALGSLLRRRYPTVVEPDSLISSGRVLVNGAPASNPAALVRADASLRIVEARPLRGTRKLAHALQALGVEVEGLVALDLGAAAGGFTRALLDAGARRVYAVDAGVGQLRGALRIEPRVVNLERTNLAALGPERIDEPIDLLTADLSYLSLAAAIAQFDRIPFTERARALVLVKPTFELHAGTLARSERSLALARGAVTSAFARFGWTVLGTLDSAIRGSGGAIEAFVYARRDPGARGPSSRSVTSSGSPSK